MKISLAIVVSFLFFGLFGTAFGQPPSDFLSWLNMLDNDEYRLVSAVDQNDCWFSVRVDSQGDILFSCHEHSAGSIDSEFVLRVQDEDGNDLHDSESEKRNPDTIKIVSTSQMKVGDVFTETELVHEYLAGTIYALKSRELNPIEVIYTRHSKDGLETELFRQRILLPSGG